MVRILLGIDDTDDLESRGTGYLARSLARELAAAGLARTAGITRHQLLVDPRIPYTSHNSSACLVLEPGGTLDELVAAAGRYLAAVSSPRSDAGLCAGLEAAIAGPVVSFGDRAKREVVTEAEARRLAGESGLRLEAYRGLGIGVIGALAAVGLRRGGSDGRFLELGPMRELRGTIPLRAAREAGITRVRVTGGGTPPGDDERIDVGDWCRAVLESNEPTLLIEEVGDGSPVRWRIATKDRIREH